MLLRKLAAPAAALVTLALPAIATAQGAPEEITVTGR